MTISSSFFTFIGPKDPNALQQSVITPRVHMLGETAAVIGYIRLIQCVNKLVQSDRS